MTETCKTCRFWNSHYEHAVWEACRYNAPIADPFASVRNDHGRPLWPFTRNEDWCGQWQQKAIKRAGRDE